jgi:hypothetical protein
MPFGFYPKHTKAGLLGKESDPFDKSVNKMAGRGGGRSGHTAFFLLDDKPGKKDCADLLPGTKMGYLQTDAHVCKMEFRR